MTQAITVAAQLGPAYSASTISFKIYNIDGSQYANWTSTGFSQIGITGTFLKANVSAPDAGGYIQFSADGGSTVLSAVADIPALGTLATAASVAALNNLSAAQVVTALLAADVDGLTYEKIMREIWAQVAGNAEADDATDPTGVDYYGPDGVSVELTLQLSGATRTRA